MGAVAWSEVLIAVAAFHARRAMPDSGVVEASGFAFHLRYKRQEPPRVVVHDLPQHLVARVCLLQLGYEDGQRLGVRFSWVPLLKSDEKRRLPA